MTTSRSTPSVARALPLSRALLLALALAVVGGCQHVRPWQRGDVADPRMRWTHNPERAASREHVLSVREGTQGGHGEFGSGCGCD